MTVPNHVSVSPAKSPNPISKCICCGSNDLFFSPVLWDELIEQWTLSPEEISYIDRQQGLKCMRCSSTLRAMALANGIMSCWGYSGTFKRFSRKIFRRVAVLEVNPAANLTVFSRKMGPHILAEYPNVDITSLPYADQSFDLVVHSDTLEHVADPIKALQECRRVLRPRGFCVFTIPLIVGRMTTTRAGKSPSYHGRQGARMHDYLVHTEYGADAWTHVMEAGFRECRIVSIEYPAAQAIVGVRGP